MSNTPSPHGLTKDDILPKNSSEVNLGILEKEILDKAGSTICDPNGWVRVLLDHLRGKKGLEFSPSRETPSVLSGEPGVLYRSNERGGGVEIPLTASETVPYLSHDLRPEEFSRLMVIFGDHCDIHDDF
jgi:hypothetical protein